MQFPSLREHARLICGVAAGLALALFLTLPGCGTTVDPLDSAKKINEAQLTTEVNQQQGAFDKQAATLNQTATTTLASYQQDAAALKAKYAAAAAQLQTDTQKYNSDVATFNANVDAAQQDLAKQASVRAQVVNIAGGFLRAATTGTFDPASALGTAITAVMGLGVVGAAADSAAKTKALSVKNQQIAQLSGADPATVAPPANGGGAPALVQAGAPSIVEGGLGVKAAA